MILINVIVSLLYFISNFMYFTTMMLWSRGMRNFNQRFGVQECKLIISKGWALINKVARSLIATSSRLPIHNLILTKRVKNIDSPVFYICARPNHPRKRFPSKSSNSSNISNQIIIQHQKISKQVMTKIFRQKCFRRRISRDSFH